MAYKLHRTHPQELRNHQLLNPSS